MAVNKELLARYKEMKAKGIQISLAELKAQMEGVNETSSTITNNNDDNSSLVNETAGSISNSNDDNKYFGNDVQNISASYNSNDNFSSTNTTNHNNSYTANDNCNIGGNIFSNTNYTQTSKSEANTDTNIWKDNSSNNLNPPQQIINNTECTEGLEKITCQNSQQKNSWTTTYSAINDNTTGSGNFKSDNSNLNDSYSKNYSNSFKVNFSQNLESIHSPESYSNTTNSIGTTTTLTPAPMQYNNNIQQNICSQADTINSPIRKFALIGYPLGHSLSSYIHDAGFKSLGLNASYEIMETPPETLVDRIKYLKTNNYYGFNVTIPLKLPVTMFLNEIDASADIVNAVNTVTIDPVTKELKGYNTDVIGFKNAIPKDFALCGKTAGILGTGGAARAAITALAQSQMKEIKLYTRNVPNSFELVNYLRKTFPNVEFNTYQIERIRDLSDINILVNTTPIGMLGRAADMTPVEENELRTLPPDSLVYDVIYNPKRTILLNIAQKYGYRTLNGVDMFIHQALAAEQIWTGRTPDFKDMKIAALENL